MLRPNVLMIGFTVSLFLLAGSGLAADKAIVACDGSDSRKELPIFTSAEHVWISGSLRCGQEVEIISSEQGYSKVQAGETVGYVISSALRKLETLESLRADVQRLEAELRRQRTPEPSPRASQPQSTATASNPPVVTGASHPASNQQSAAPDYPRAELFGGYSYRRFEGGGNLNGGTVSVAGNLTRYFGIVGDISGHFIKEGKDSFQLYTFSAGPRFSFRSKKVTPFAHALVGVALGSYVTEEYGGSSTAFTMALGGGLDVALSTHFAIRAQAEYAPLMFGGSFLNTLRASAGVVIRF